MAYVYGATIKPTPAPPPPPPPAPVPEPVKDYPMCGTRTGARQHKARGEAVCDLCKKANADYARSSYKTRRKKPLKPCGTTAAYRRHLHRGEIACDLCLLASRADYYSRKESANV